MQENVSPSRKNITTNMARCSAPPIFDIIYMFCRRKALRSFWYARVKIKRVKRECRASGQEQRPGIVIAKVYFEVEPSLCQAVALIRRHRISKFNVCSAWFIPLGPPLHCRFTPLSFSLSLSIRPPAECICLLLCSLSIYLSFFLPSLFSSHIASLLPSIHIHKQVRKYIHISAQKYVDYLIYSRICAYLYAIQRARSWASEFHVSMKFTQGTLTGLPSTIFA